MHKQHMRFSTLLLCICLLVSCLALRFGYRQYLQVCYPNFFDEIVVSCAESNGLSSSLLMAVIYTESHFDASATSSANAMGLMQLTEDTFFWAQMRAGVKDTEQIPTEQLFDPHINIQYGSYVLRLLQEEFENEDTALAAYNAGIGTVRGWLADPQYSDDEKTLKAIPFTETNNYVKRVRAAQEMYRLLYAYS